MAQTMRNRRKAKKTTKTWAAAAELDLATDLATVNTRRKPSTGLTKYQNRHKLRVGGAMKGELGVLSATPGFKEKVRFEVATKTARPYPVRPSPPHLLTDMATSPLKKKGRAKVEDLAPKGKRRGRKLKSAGTQKKKLLTKSPDSVKKKRKSAVRALFSNTKAPTSPLFPKPHPLPKLGMSGAPTSRQEKGAGPARLGLSPSPQTLRTPPARIVREIRNSPNSASFKNFTMSAGTAQLELPYLPTQTPGGVHIGEVRPGPVTTGRLRKPQLQVESVESAKRSIAKRLGASRAGLSVEMSPAKLATRSYRAPIGTRIKVEDEALVEFQIRQAQKSRARSTTAAHFTKKPHKLRRVRLSGGLSKKLKLKQKTRMTVAQVRKNHISFINQDYRPLSGRWEPFGWESEAAAVRSSKYPLRAHLPEPLKKKKSPKAPKMHYNDVGKWVEAPKTKEYKRPKWHKRLDRLKEKGVFPKRKKKLEPPKKKTKTGLKPKKPQAVSTEALLQIRERQTTKEVPKITKKDKSSKKLKDTLPKTTQRLRETKKIKRMLRTTQKSQELKKNNTAQASRLKIAHAVAQQSRAGGRYADLRVKKLKQSTKTNPKGLTPKRTANSARSTRIKARKFLQRLSLGQAGETTRGYRKVWEPPTQARPGTLRPTTGRTPGGMARAAYSQTQKTEARAAYQTQQHWPRSVTAQTRPKSTKNTLLADEHGGDRGRFMPAWAKADTELSASEPLRYLSLPTKESESGMLYAESSQSAEEGLAEYPTATVLSHELPIRLGRRPTALGSLFSKLRYGEVAAGVLVKKHATSLAATTLTQRLASSLLSDYARLETQHSRKTFRRALALYPNLTAQRGHQTRTGPSTHKQPKARRLRSLKTLQLELHQSRAMSRKRAEVVLR